MFNFARYMLIGSTRSYLPAHLQGKWARDAVNPWNGGEYRSQLSYQNILNVVRRLWQVC